MNHDMPTTSHGAKESLDAFFPRVYSELHELAERALGREEAGHTLGATELVHEAYMRLAVQNLPTADQARFFGLAAEMMRRILVNHALARRTAKRGGGQLCITLEDAIAGEAPNAGINVLQLDEALLRLATIDVRAAQVVELRFFGGLTLEEVAVVLKISLATVKREWSAARAWLQREMSDA